MAKNNPTHQMTVDCKICFGKTPKWPREHITRCVSWCSCFHSLFALKAVFALFYACSLHHICCRLLLSSPSQKGDRKNTCLFGLHQKTPLHTRTSRNLNCAQRANNKWPNGVFVILKHVGKRSDRVCWTSPLSDPSSARSSSAHSFSWTFHVPSKISMQSLSADSRVLCGVFHPVPSGIPVGTKQSPHKIPKSRHDAIKPPHWLKQTNSLCRSINTHQITCIVWM